MKKEYAVYILTNYAETVFYVGITNDLERRVYEHKNKLIDGFTAKYDVNKLVYYELADSIEAAINREKQLKRWRRQSKANLINKLNQEWKDLSLEWTG